MECAIRNNTCCCVPQCNSHGTINPPQSFHKFPGETSHSEMLRRQEWIRVLRIGKKVTERMRVCSKHFKSTDFFFPGVPCKNHRLQKNTVPSQCLPLTSTETQDKKEKKVHLAQIRAQRYATINEKKNTTALKPALDLPSCSKDAHDFLNCTGSIAEENDAEDLTMTAAEALLELSRASGMEIPTLPKMDKATQVTSGDLHTKVMLHIEKLSNTQINSLTGIPTRQLFDKLILYVCQELGVKPNRYLSVTERVVMSMMKLKLNLSFVVLSIIFGCTSTTSKTIFTETIQAMSSILQAAIEWPTKEEVLQNLPKCFSKTPNVRVVLDCTEIPIERPKCLRCQVMTYSTYKGGHTAKYMVCSTPGGVISFISKGYGGRASDRLILQQSGVMDMLEPCIDSVMVDKGFLIEDLCEEKLCQLVRPPFLKKGKTQLSSKEADDTRNVARARIHIERAIQRIKLFKMIQVGIVPWNLLNLLDDILVIACGVVNLSAPILSEDKYL